MTAPPSPSVRHNSDNLRSIGKYLVAVVAAVVGWWTVTPVLTTAHAAGEIIVVEPAVATPGQEVLVTISNIAASSFCDYLPYAGDGYTSTAYIRNLQGDFHDFSIRSEPFDPRRAEAISFVVQVPFNWPIGQASITGDCWAPSGQQTGNTARPFVIDIVKELSDSAQMPSTSDEQSGPDLSEAEAVVSDPSVNEELLGPGRQAAQPPAIIAFRPERLGSGNRHVLWIEGQELISARGLTISLSSPRGSQVVHSFDNWGLELSEPIALPFGLAEGVYTLRAEAESTHSGGLVYSNSALVVSGGTYYWGRDRIEIQPSGQLPAWLWTTTAAMSLLGLIIVFWSFSLRRSLRQPSTI